MSAEGINRDSCSLLLQNLEQKEFVLDGPHGTGNLRVETGSASGDC